MDGAVQTVRWKPVSGATFYNLVLWRDGKRVLDLWPTSPRAVLPRDWSYRGGHHRLRAGRYLWFVYPGFGAKASRQYGTLDGSGVVVVKKQRG
jgi:hypothetical protein